MKSLLGKFVVPLMGLSLLISSLIFLDSCSSEKQWVKPDCGDTEFKKDYYECKSQGSRDCLYTVGRGIVIQQQCINSLTKDCLYSRGWEYRKP